jgi:hypothetical protein
MVRLKTRDMAVRRYLAFYTLAFALMGRHVKSIYFNDLLGIPNDNERMEKSGELRDIKRTKSEYGRLQAKLSDSTSDAYQIACGMNQLIALVDADPALHFRGNEAAVMTSLDSRIPKSVAVVVNSYNGSKSLTVVNTGGNKETVAIRLDTHDRQGFTELVDNITGNIFPVDPDGILSLHMGPYQRLWLTKEKINIPTDHLWP